MRANSGATSNARPGVRRQYFHGRQEYATQLLADDVAEQKPSDIDGGCLVFQAGRWCYELFPVDDLVPEFVRRDLLVIEVLEGPTGARP